MTIVYRGMLEVGNPSTIEQGTSRPETPEVGGSHEGSSRVIGETALAAAASQRMRPQSQPK